MTLPVPSPAEAEASRLIAVLAGFIGDPIPSRLSADELDVSKEGVFGGPGLAVHVYTSDEHVAQLVLHGVQQAGYKAWLRSPQGPPLTCGGSPNQYCVHLEGLSDGLMMLPWVNEFVAELQPASGSVAVYTGTYLGERPRIDRGSSVQPADRRKRRSRRTQ